MSTACRPSPESIPLAGICRGPNWRQPHPRRPPGPLLPARAPTPSGTEVQPLFFGEAPRLTVQRERCRSLREGHPWVYDGVLKHPPKNLPAGLVVDLLDE
ncbi:MAG: hypothetical protein HUU35_00845, partial [Armatimonadetes bacterium]|nr:hypothetical protein [Armatimonadota bacterium]